MNVLMISPGFPVEQPFYTEGLAKQGAHVIGLGDQPEDQIPERARRSLAAYFRVESFSDEDAIVQQVSSIAGQVSIDQVECTWEPFMTLAAKLREHLSVPGMTVQETIPFRDKEVMKRILDQHGVRTPRHTSTQTKDGVRLAAEKIGYPICVKPIAGAGSADTYRVDDSDAMESVLDRLGHVREVSVEEFIEGEEFTFDTICVNGQIMYFNISMYRPRPLTARSVPWISPQTIALRDLDQPELEAGKALGASVLKALGFQTGFTHMEWFLKPDGEAVFGEIAARPPGANSVDLMNFVGDVDLFSGWAEAVVHGQFTQSLERKYNSGNLFKRAQGAGRIQQITGLEGLMADFGEHIRVVDLLPIGAPRRDWKQTLRSDGMVVFRHPDLNTLFHIADAIGTRLQMYAN